MNGRQALLTSLVVVAGSAALLYAVVPSPQTPPAATRVVTMPLEGVQMVMFDSPKGTVTVFFPGDVSAGDTVAGAAVVESKGKDADELARNLADLRGYTVELAGLGSTSPRQTISVGIYGPGGQGPVGGSFRLILPRSALLGAREDFVSFKDGGGSTVGRLAWADFQKLMVRGGQPDAVALAATMPARGEFRLPELGQAGRPVEIYGGFDGDLATTTLRIGDLGVTPVAESSRKCIFIAPSSLSGLLQMTLGEAGVNASAEYRNIPLRVAVPTTKLDRGEKTTVTIELVGLRGLQRTLPLHLERTGVVTLEGGDVQTVSIAPTEVTPEGTFRMTRVITARQQGTFAVTVGIVVLNGCLFDETNGHQLSFSSATGDYMFCPRESAPDAGFRLGGLAAVARKGFAVTLQHDASDRKLLIELDEASRSGTAKVQTSRPKLDFAITDKDTRNNSCTCR